MTALAANSRSPLLHRWWMLPVRANGGRRIVRNYNRLVEKAYRNTEPRTGKGGHWRESFLGELSLRSQTPSSNRLLNSTAD
jgi:hypothetical protein